jgi:hypothetical protein
MWLPCTASIVLGRSCTAHTKRPQCYSICSCNTVHDTAHMLQSPSTFDFRPLLPLSRAVHARLPACLPACLCCQQEVLGELLVEEASAYVLGQEEADLQLNQVKQDTLTQCPGSAWGQQCHAASLKQRVLRLSQCVCSVGVWRCPRSGIHG